MRIGIISVGAVFTMTLGVLAQSTDTDTSRVLKAAKASDDAETSQIAKEKSANGPTLDRLAQQAKNALAYPPDAESKQVLSSDGQKLDQTLKTLSPEAQKLLTQAQSSGAPALRTPDADSVIAKNAPAVPTAPAAKPAVADKKGGDDKPVPPVDKDVHITCQGAAYFDSREAIGVFTDDVEVLHPGFHLFAEQLEVYMIKDSDKPKPPEPGAAPAAAPGTQPKAAATPVRAPVVPGTIVSSTSAVRTGDADATPPPAAPAAAAAEEKSKTAEPDKNIRQAIARGRKVIIIKNTETGENQVGVCRNATYVGESGDIIMRDMPLVQRGNHVCYATDPSTYMIITQEGKLHTYGPNKVDIIEEKEKKVKDPNAAPAAPVPPAPGPAAPAKPGPAKPPSATPKKK